MTRDPWVVRVLRRTSKDRQLLSAFRCGADVGWLREVQTFIVERLFEWRFEPLAAANDPRALLVFHRRTNRLVAVVAHERVQLGTRRRQYRATKLEVVAVAADWQGQRFENGVRVSDVVMSAAMQDIGSRVPPRDARVFAIVHEANTRSVKLCQRYGMVDELSREDDAPSYRRFITAHRRRRQRRLS